MLFRFILDTDGRGWITAAEVEESDEATVPSASAIQNDDDDFVQNVEENPCAGLHLQEEPSACGGGAVVPIPAFDDDRHPGSVVVPFAAGKRLFSVDGPPSSATNEDVPLLVRYYRLAVGCTSATPDRFQRDVRDWLDSAVVPLLGSHRRWYSALAGVTRVVRAATKATATTTTAKAAGIRPKRKVILPDSSTVFDVDGWPGCDDSPSGQLPNTNVFLLVILLSLIFIWFCFGTISIHKGIRRVLDLLLH